MAWLEILRLVIRIGLLVGILIFYENIREAKAIINMLSKKRDLTNKEVLKKMTDKVINYNKVIVLMNKIYIVLAIIGLIITLF